MVEHAPNFERDKNDYELEKDHEKKIDSPETKIEVRTEALLDLEKIREKINQNEQVIVPPNERKANEATAPTPPPNEELKKITLSKTMSKVRDHLTSPEKNFSKIVHKPTVDKISDVAGNTIVRPIGFMFGALFALIGSSVALYLSRRYGFKYHFITFLIFFAGGFIIGIVIEVILNISHHRKKV